MDWDGVGTFAMFLSSGAIGLGIIALRAYKATLAARLERERLRYSAGESPELDDAMERIASLEEHVHRLTERADFTDRLLTERSGIGADEPRA